ncbi:LuxR C-terminal-related transcriptional regulator [Haliea sp.]|uniref:LuxR C-terminal-related transcriptional regulator n=1 Tax=Haliea sp. TaxID=1932666 RepID=UPI0025BC125A|nr:LuxR C-terminal-related transcriptional regulator [Haliea sp.]
MKADLSSDGALFPPWLVPAKVYPPVPRVDVLIRRGLELKLNEGLSRQATILRAPAGYGKSTLLSSWLQHLPCEAAACCWLALDEDDDDERQLLVYLAFSLYQAGVLRLGEDDGVTLQGEVVPRQILTLIQRSIEALSEPVLLILDDFEQLSGSTVRSVIQRLLRYAPENLHLFVATRDDSALDVSRLEVEGAVLRVDAAALQFTLPEIRELFADQLPAGVIEDIYRRTGGWPVVVQMLRSALSSERDHDRLLQELDSDAATLSAYLAHQILDGLAPADQQFLMSLSPLERVDCVMADFVREATDSLARVHQLKHLHCLIRSISSPGETVELHPLLRDHLYRRLQLQAPELLRRLHGRIAEWHARELDLVNAVRHSVLADEPDRAIDIIESMGAISLWLREGITRIRLALRLLNPEVIGRSPLLLLLQAIIEVKDGMVFKASQTYRSAEHLAVGDQSIRPSSASGALLNDFRQIDAYLAIYSGHQIQETSYRALLDSTAEIDREGPGCRAFHYNLLCVVHTQQGDFRSARLYAREAIRNFREIGSLYGESYLYFHQGDASFAEGKSDSAEKLYRKGLDIARRKFGEDKGIRLIGHVLMLELMDELGRDDFSLSVLRQLPRELEAREAWFDIYLAGYCTASNIEFRRSGLVSALRLLDKAMKYADQQRLARLEDLLVCQRIELLVRAGQLKAARSLVSDSGMKLADYRQGDGKQAAWRERDVAALAMCRLLFAEGRGREALVELEYFSEDARHQGRLRSLLRYTLLMAQAAWAIGEETDAQGYMAEALTLSEHTGFIRPLLDEGAYLDELITLVLTGQALSEHTVQHALSIQKRFTAAEVRDKSVTVTLSAREQEIMTLLAVGASNKSIARDLDLSENTVRFHLKNVFRKLNVHNRVQAVMQASLLLSTGSD